MIFGIYSRKSVYTGKGESIENQIEMCKEYIYRKYKDVEEENIVIYEDEGFSGKNIDRPELQRMQQDIKNKKLDMVICYRLDRISRNVSDFSNFIENLNKQDISFVCIKEEFDTTKPMGKAMMYIASVFAQLERETIAERVRDNMLMLARTGRWLGGTTPTGYTSTQTQEIIIDGKMKTAFRLKENPSEMKIIKIIFKKYEELQSVSGVSKFLIKENIKSRNGTFFSNLGIKEILQNPVYCIADEKAWNYFNEKKSDVCFEQKDIKPDNHLGILSYNKRNYSKKNAPRNSMDQWIIAMGKHKGIIRGERWVSIQQNIISKAQTPTAHHPIALLSGLIVCENCQNKMFAKQRSNSTKLFDYICNHKLRGGAKLCNMQNLNGQQADDIVCEQLLQYTKEDSNIYKLLNNLKKEINLYKTEDHITEIESQIKNCEKERNHLIDLISKNDLETIVIKQLNNKIKNIEIERQKLEAEKNQLKTEKKENNNKELELDLLTTALSSLKNNFKTLEIEDKRTLIRIIVDKIIWDGKDLHIFINSE